MVGVTSGKESSFITSILSLPIVESATPHIVAQLKTLTEQLDLTEYCEANPDDILCKPVPLNVKSGVVVIDNGFLSPDGHGYKVDKAITDNGGTIGSLVNLPIENCTIEKCGFDGKAVSTDMTVKAIVAAAQGNSIFNPEEPLIVNLSMNGREGNTKAESRDNIKYWTSTVLRGISNLSTDIRNKGLAVNIAIGNEKLDLTNVLAEIRKDSALANIMSKYVLLVGTSQTFSDTNYGSNTITGKDKDVVISNNSEAKYGTSPATAAVSAIIDQLIRKGFTSKQALSACKSADDNNGHLTLEGALSILSPTPTPTPTPTLGTYTGTFSGKSTETIDCARWKDNIYATITITVSGSGTLIDPYSGSMKIEGSVVVSLVYCNCDPGCDPGGTVALSGTGTVSGSQGKVEASASGTVGAATFTASFTGGTFSGNTLTGTFTFSYDGQDAPIVKTITLTK